MKGVGVILPGSSMITKAEKVGLSNTLYLSTDKRLIINNRFLA
jgi:hypothetical protein